jgi:hypothetical protein
MLLHFILYLYLHAICVLAGPQYQLPFNAQVPDVAFVNTSYSFTLSPSTFLSNYGPISYSITGAPSWVQFDSDTMTIHGTPSSSDAGSPLFSLTATDSTGSTTESVTLVVSSAPRVQLRENFTFPLQSPGKGCGSECVVFPPSMSFEIQFSSSMFVGTEGDALFYYATLGDHTPLPAWMAFTASNLSFTGISPTVKDLSESLAVDFVGTDVAGFSVVRVAFRFSVSEHQFAFSQSYEEINVPAGQAVNITSLIKTLTLDGSPITSDDLLSATVDGPSWLEFDPKTLSLYGKPPNPYVMANVTVEAEDKYGETAEMTIVLNLGYAELYTGHIGTLNATAGEPFSYQLDSSDILETNLTILTNLGAASQWLSFNPKTLSIAGTIPVNTPSQIVPANITFIVPNGTIWDAQDFYIQIGKFPCPNWF